MNLFRNFKNSFLFLSVLFLFLQTGCNRDPNFVRGESYSMHFPLGWIRTERAIEPPFNMESKFPIQDVTFVTPQVNPDTNMPDAMITMHVVRPFQPFWLEDDFPMLVDSLARGGFPIINKGQIKLDEQVSNWVLYRDDLAGRIRLDFFAVNDSGTVFRLQYSAAMDKFGIYRKFFEEARSTIKVRKW